MSGVLVFRSSSRSMASTPSTRKASSSSPSSARRRRRRASPHPPVSGGAFSSPCGTAGPASSGLGRYSGKYALSGLLFCGECGTAYRRVVWTQHGEKRTVWRCCSRLDYGKKYCEHSPTLDETPLQQAILNAVNASMSDHGTLSARLDEHRPCRNAAQRSGPADRLSAGDERKGKIPLLAVRSLS